MKFLAVLKDSLREAVDTKVFYVMVGLSVVVTLITATITFTPKESGNDFMKMAAAPLSIENFAELESAGPEELMRVLLHSDKGLYETVEVAPVNGAVDGPRSRFRVVVRAIGTRPGAAEKMREDPGPTIEHIRKRFGVIDSLHLVSVEDVRMVERPKDVEVRQPGEAFFEITTKPSDATLRLWPHTWSLFVGGWAPTETALPLGLQLYAIEEIMVGWIGASITILVSIIITAFFIPNMLRKGTVDLLIVKPIHRSTLLSYKFVGGLLFMFLNTAVAITGVWLALSLRSGIWAMSLFYMVPVLTFSFAILYAVSTLFAVLTRSPIVAILVTCFVWVVLFVVSIIHGYWESVRIREDRDNVAKEMRSSEGVFPKVVYGIHYVLPRRDDLGTLTSNLLVSDLLTANQIKAGKLNRERVSWTESLLVSCLFIGVMLGLSCWWFSSKDY